MGTTLCILFQIICQCTCMYFLQVSSFFILLDNMHLFHLTMSSFPCQQLSSHQKFPEFSKLGSIPELHGISGQSPVVFNLESTVGERPGQQKHPYLDVFSSSLRYHLICSLFPYLMEIRVVIKVLSEAFLFFSYWKTPSVLLQNYMFTHVISS